MIKNIYPFKRDAQEQRILKVKKKKRKTKSLLHSAGRTPVRQVQRV